MTLAALSIPVSVAPYNKGICGVTTSLGSPLTMTFNAAADKLAFVFQAPSNTVPDLAAFYCNSHTSTGTVDCTLETVDGTTGFPSGTPVTNSGTASVSVASTGVKTAAGMAGTATVSAGSTYAIVMTATGGFAGNFQIQYGYGSTTGLGGSPYLLTKDSAGAWTKQGQANVGIPFGVADSGGTYFNIPGLVGAASSVAFQAYGSATNPDERGSRFQFAEPVTLWGAEVWMTLGSGPASAQDFTLTVYSDPDNVTAPTSETTQAFDGDNQWVGAVRTLMLASPENLAANTPYALTILATGAGNIQPVRYDYASSAHLPSFVDSNFYAVTRNNSAGALSGTNTQAYAVFPIISKIDDGASVGGGGSQRVIGG